MLAGVVCDSAPEQREDVEVAVLLVDAGASEFENLRADRFERGEIKFLSAVEAEVLGGAIPGLHAVGADDFPVEFNEEMVACGVVGVFVTEGEEGRFEALFEFEVEDEEAQGLSGADVILSGGEAHGVLLCGGGAREDATADGGRFWCGGRCGGGERSEGRARGLSGGRGSGDRDVDHRRIESLRCVA